MDHQLTFRMDNDERRNHVRAHDDSQRLQTGPADEVMMSKGCDTAPSGPVACRAFLACRWDDVVLTRYGLVIRWCRGGERGGSQL